MNFESLLLSTNQFQKWEIYKNSRVINFSVPIKELADIGVHMA